MNDDESAGKRNQTRDEAKAWWRDLGDAEQDRLMKHRMPISPNKVRRMRESLQSDEDQIDLEQIVLALRESAL
jgi:hypothetical protein